MKIVNNIRPDRQTLLFSATFPAKMDALARKILIKPLEITVGGRSVVAKEITQQVEIRDADQKFLRLLEILGEMGEKHKDEEDFRTLIFVERQESADELFRELMRKGYICTSLHGGKDQVDRDQAIADFKLGYIPIVIATSVAARGLDVKELKLVINYDCPNHMEDYVHRAGRTGRAGNSGTCVTFVQSDQERYAVDIVRALKASEATVPPELEKMSEGEFRPCKLSHSMRHPTDFIRYLCSRLPDQGARRKGQGRWIWVRWKRSGQVRSRTREQGSSGTSLLRGGRRSCREGSRSSCYHCQRRQQGQGQGRCCCWRDCASRLWIRFQGRDRQGSCTGQGGSCCWWIVSLKDPRYRTKHSRSGRLQASCSDPGCSSTSRGGRSRRQRHGEPSICRRANHCQSEQDQGGKECGDPGFPAGQKFGCDRVSRDCAHQRLSPEGQVEGDEQGADGAVARIVRGFHHQQG